MNQIGRLIALLIAVPMAGALGFYFIEQWTFFESLYMAVTTVTTVGFGELYPLSQAGRTFVIAYLIVGLGVFLYSAAALGELVMRAELRTLLGNRMMEKELKNMSNHFVVCGLGRMGRALCEELSRKHQPFIVVERDEQVMEDARQEQWPWINGDATDDRVLLAAGIRQAKGLATVLSSDADNLYVVLSARLLHPELHIIARSTDEDSAAKMRRAGADRVISLYQTSAVRMARMLGSPILEDFFEVLATHDTEIDLAEIKVTATDGYIGKTLADTDLSQRGIVVVGLRRANGELILPPGPNHRIQSGDCLIALGRSEAISDVIET